MCTRLSCRVEARPPPAGCGHILLPADAVFPLEQKTPYRPCQVVCRLFPRCRHRASGLTPPRSPAPTPLCRNCSASPCRVDTSVARLRAGSLFPRACFHGVEANLLSETRCLPLHCWKNRLCVATSRAPSSDGIGTCLEISFGRQPGCTWQPGHPVRVCPPSPTPSPPRW